ncbi:MAG: ComF family protein [Aminivibrio sp.]
MSIPEAALRFAAHLFWPSSCPFCGAPGTAACVKCLLPLLSPPLAGETGGLRHEAGGVHEGVLRELALELKYGRNRPLGIAMGRALGRIFPRPDCDVLTPVPLHRESERGYNQSMALARGISMEWGIPALEGLRWKEPRAVQTSLGRKERRDMPADALIPLGNLLEGKRVTLVDDVSTTGTTLLRAAGAVERAKGKAVMALTWTIVPGP